MTITLTVSGRIASVDATTHVVAGNTYPVALSLDSEWTGSLYLRVRFGSLYYDIPFASSDTSVDVQMPVGYPEVGIGVFSEALQICSCEARIRLLRSILEAGEQVVEFDSDLYDQWAGEVTTLLTDDAFDAESTRPVQNAVLTAWKDTVPLDANLVHKTGAETITGAKTFNSLVSVESSASAPEIRIVSREDASIGWKNRIRCYATPGGQTRQLTSMETYMGADYNRFLVRTPNPSASKNYDLDLRMFSDHMTAKITPWYPVDGSGNPIPVDEAQIMTSGNIAVDPRIVHTTGNETVAGEKTYLGTATFSKNTPTIDCKSTVANTGSGRKGLVRFYDVKDGQPSLYSEMVGYTVSGQTGLALGIYAPGRTGTERTLDLRCYDDAFVVLQDPPHLPVDGSGNPQALTTKALMTSGNIAVDPRIVHTTGNETVAGTKTFSGNVVNANSLDNRHIDVVGWASQTANWWPLFTMSMATYAKGTMVHILDVNDNLYGEFFLTGFQTTILAFRYVGEFPVARVRLARKGSTMTLLVSTTTSSNRLHVWCGQDIQSVTETPHPSTPCLVKVESRTAQDEPVVGSAWDAVITPTER